MHRIKRKSYGLDGVQFWVLRDFAFILSSRVTTIFNKSPQSCIVPLNFKLANVSPIPKCPCSTAASDYRPIPLLPILSKLLEKLILRKCILPHVGESLDCAHFAHQSTGSGTITALTLLHHRIISCLDSSPGIPSDLNRLEESFQKAEALRHHVSSGKVRFACSNSMLDRDFFRDRYQRMASPTQLSSWVPVTNGIPLAQGSVLGLILFRLALINSLCAL